MLKASRGEDVYTTSAVEDLMPLSYRSIQETESWEELLKQFQGFLVLPLQIVEPSINLQGMYSMDRNFRV